MKKILIFLFLVCLLFAHTAWKQPRGEKEKRKEPEFSIFLKTAFFGTRLPAEDKPVNRAFVLLLAGAGTLLFVSRTLGLEPPPPYASLSAVVYFTCLLLYGFWILNFLSDLPFGLDFSAVRKIIFAGGGVFTALVLMDHRMKTRKTLAPGYMKCPHCGEVIVLLSVECFVCKGKIN